MFLFFIKTWNTIEKHRKTKNFNLSKIVYISDRLKSVKILLIKIFYYLFLIVH